jgi:hypothetical protein
VNGRFKDILSVGYGESLTFCESERYFFFSIFGDLGNSESILSILEHSGEPLSISNAIESLRLRCKFNLPFDHLLSFITTHLNEFPITSFVSLSDHIVELIISDGKLKLSSEDSLYDLISR